MDLTLSRGINHGVGKTMSLQTYVCTREKPTARDNGGTMVVTISAFARMDHKACTPVMTGTNSFKCLLRFAIVI